MTDNVLQGGCQCGAVRYEVTGEPVVVAICHCSMCRRANAAPAVAWAMYPENHVRFTGDALKIYKSSPPARRGFCGNCGTQISFTANHMPGLIDLTVGSFDKPGVLTPALHYWDSKRLPWVRFDDDLPKHPEFPPFE
jgi:hypothetical protein